MENEKKVLDEYVVNKLNAGISVSDIFVLVKHYFNYKLSRKTFQNYIGVVRRKYKKKIFKPSDFYEDALVRIKASNQKLQDKNRIANKFLREHNRYLNFTSDLFEEILNKLKSFNTFKLGFKNSDIKIENKTAVVQLTDLHLGEVVTQADSLGFNEYGIEICSKRLWKFARKIKEFLGDSVSEITIALTGDLLNSDRRIDEMLTNVSNRSEALIWAVQLISCFLIDLAKDYKLKVLSVFGNESRFDIDMPYMNPTHNFDFLIHKFLSMYLSQYKERIEFLDIDRNYEKLYRVGDLNILFFHGYKYKPSMLNIIVAKYNKLGKIIDYAITGHIHSTENQESQGRAGSIVGTNFHSTFGLHLISKASQNLYLIEKEDGAEKASISSISIDLQNVNKCNKYPYDLDVCKM